MLVKHRFCYDSPEFLREDFVTGLTSDCFSLERYTLKFNPKLNLILQVVMSVLKKEVHQDAVVDLIFSDNSLYIELTEPSFLVVQGFKKGGLINRRLPVTVYRGCLPYEGWIDRVGSNFSCPLYVALYELLIEVKKNSIS